MQHILDGPLVYVGKHLVYWHGQAWAKGEVQAIIGCCRLKLKVKGAADFLSEGHSPSPVDPGAKWSVDHQLHPATFVKEPFCHDFGFGRNDSQDTPTLFQIGNQLATGFFVHPGLSHNPGNSFWLVVQTLVNAFAEV